MHEFRNDYLKPKCFEIVKLCYMDRDTCFILYIKTDDIYKDIPEDVKPRTDT